MNRLVKPIAKVMATAFILSSLYFLPALSKPKTVCYWIAWSFFMKCETVQE